MTITYSIDHAPSSTESVLVEIAPKSEMVAQATKVDPKTNVVSTDYILASGDARFPGVVTYWSGIQKRSNALARVFGGSLSTWAVASDSVSGIDTRAPMGASLSIYGPANATIELADVNNLLGNIFSLMYSSQASGVRTTTYLQKLLYGLSAVV